METEYVMDMVQISNGLNHCRLLYGGIGIFMPKLPNTLVVSAIANVDAPNVTWNWKSWFRWWCNRTLTYIVLCVMNILMYLTLTTSNMWKFLSKCERQAIIDNRPVSTHENLNMTGWGISNLKPTICHSILHVKRGGKKSQQTCKLLRKRETSGCRVQISSMSCK